MKNAVSQIDGERIGHVVRLAERANVRFAVVNDQLVMRWSHVRWPLWKMVREKLDEIGLDRLKDYCKTTH